jgi:hypothetical protein
MPTYIEKTQKEPAITKADYLNRATDSSARKFTSPDSVQNNSPTDSVSNVEHVISALAGIKSLAISAENISALAKAEIARAEATILNLNSEPNLETRSQQGQFNESDVNALQRAVANAASAGLEKIGNTEIKDQMKRQAQLFIMNSRHQLMPIRPAGSQARIVNQFVPELESITVDIDTAASTVDSFSATLLFNLPAASTGKVRGIRIFRAQLEKPIFTRPLSTLSAAGIDRLMTYRGRKNQDDASAASARHVENDVPNSVGKLNSFDPFTGLRTSADGRAVMSAPPPLAGKPANQRFFNVTFPDAMQHLDPSVLENINVLSNLKSNPDLNFNITLLQPVTVGNILNTGLQLGQYQVDQVTEFTSKTTTVVESGNKLDFQEIAYLTTDKIKGRRVQGRMEYTFKDSAIAFGQSYKYFIATVDNNMIQSQRSAISTVTVEGLRVPERPRSISSLIEQTRITLAITAADLLIEKFEVYRFEHDVNRTKTATAMTIGDEAGFSTRFYKRDISSNNYLLIGECINPMKGGAEFIDPFVKPGHFYTYRVYAVDIFGNKSESPLSTEIYVPDLQQQYTYLQKPALLAEVDAATSLMSITFSCDDKNVEKLQLERRDLTIGQTSFTVPTSPPRTVLGLQSVSKSRRMLGELMTAYAGQPDDFHWNGVFVNKTGSQQVFIDPAVQFDHIYQYRMYGEDRYGNKSSYAVTSPTMLVRRPFVNAPLDLSATLDVNSSSVIDSVTISWTEANLDIAAEELIGNQPDLEASRKRTLYSVQRKKKDDDNWQSFSLMTGTSLVDYVDWKGTGRTAPNYRPPYLELNKTYAYRVQAVQSGVFLSNFTAPVEVFVGFNVAEPANFTIRTPSTYLRPFYVMLNWDTRDSSGIVDRWEIQRCAVNNIAAARLNLKNQDEFSKLNFAEFRTVYRESSRFSGKVQDPLFSDKQIIDQTIITGQHCFMDTQVDFGNSYFYRIRAISPEGTQSAWSYKGIKLTSTVFEQKWMPILTDEEKQILTQSMLPMLLAKGPRIAPKSSLSMQPDFSKPDSSRSAPRTSVVMGDTE